MTRSLPATICAGSGLSIFATVTNHGIRRPLRVPHREIALVILHRRDRNVFRQLEEARLELPRERDRPFDQGGDLVEQPIVDHRLATDGPRGLA